MARLISLSRAARLVGVKRTTLQRQIQAGDLHTFEGELDLSELLRVYPQTKIEDSAMLERADRMIERALTRVVRDQNALPDAEVLAHRVAALSHELGATTYRVRRYDRLLEQLRDYLRKLATANSAPGYAEVNALRDWLDESLEQVHAPIDEEGELYATDMLLRVMAAQVHLQPSGHEFFVQGNENLLDSGLRAGLALDYGCRDGGCGHCRARVTKGLVKLMRKPRYRLSEQERTDGVVLMCCNTAVTDVTLEVVEVSQPQQIRRQSLTARVGSVERVGVDVALLSLRPADNLRLRFLAGQSVRLSIGECSGTYFIASCPCDEHQLEFHIRLCERDAFAQQLFAGLDLNGQVEIVGPDGDGVLNQESGRPVIFVAWDAGFAPVKSLLEQAMALDVAESLHLYRVFSGGDQPYLHNRCRAWADALENFQYTPLLTDARSSGDDDEAHALQATLFAAIAEPHFNVAAFDFYFAAPRPVLLQAQRYFNARGVPDAQFHALEVPH